MIRLATTKDLPDLVDMGLKFHEAAGVQIPFDRDSTLSTLESLIVGDAGFVLVNKDATGMIGVFLSPAYFNHGYVMAQELFWWVNPDSRGDGIKLLIKAEIKAKEMGANGLSMISLDSSTDVSNLYLKRGYESLERHFLKVL